MMRQNTSFAGDKEELKKIIHYSKRFDEYMIRVSDNSPSGICIHFCPWCGRELPASKRRMWFDELDKLGIEYSLFDTQNIPSEYLSDEWWKNRIKKY